MPSNWTAYQESFVAALEAADKFAHRAQIKTWVFSILKNKVIDIIRRRCREPVISFPVDEIPADAFDPLFDEQGYWRREERPAVWGDPQKTLENAQFWRILDACLHRLPDNTSRVFMMREFLGFDTGEICKELAITSTNCWVILHRARMGLCLQDNWFGASEGFEC
ncbi:MAG: sigma-70 family RNA polymerase sigma factor [Gammaproteobacteria bacterium]|nr:sigma-70 family RNA polymerase sigma factor [Gammaproteobacteria bacterium]MBU1654822.1 sigma-70 family RNA polymerase sigma factor [Gammaproteobacteria bacterium]MBU1961089.1 sigma-70 family RNA polymerase sigma factor [Gammaproteobacteria bacterium]